MYVQKIYSKANLKCKKKNTYTRRLPPPLLFLLLPPLLFLLLLLPLSCCCFRGCHRCRFRRWRCCFRRHHCCCCRRRRHRHRRCCARCHRCRTHDPLVEPLLRLSSLLHSFVHPHSHLHCSSLFGPCPCSSAPALGFVRPSPFSPSLLRARLYLHLYYLSNTT